jgi:hypothetical protein
MRKYFARLVGAAFAGLLCLLALPGSVTPAAAQGTSCLPSSLKNTLAQLNARFGTVRVISTHRSGARIAGSGKRSYHADCRAVDFHPPAGKHAAVVAWLAVNHAGGLGTYSGRHSHIHIDSGPRYRFHKGGGSSKRYASSSRRSRRG